MRNIRVLVVDDNRSDRMVLTAMLQSFNIRLIQEAEDGQVAAQKIDNAYECDVPFDLIFVDWQMPKATGLKLLQYIRSNIKLSRTGVIMITANAGEDRVEEAIQNNVDDFIIKPIQIEVLQKKLDSFFEKNNI